MLSCLSLILKECDLVWGQKGYDLQPKLCFLQDTAQKLVARVAALREGAGLTGVPPIRYVAELIGTDSDSEKAIRWLIALMVLCCDPLAIALTAGASARRSTTVKPLLVRSTFDSCRGDAIEGSQRLWANSGNLGLLRLITMAFMQKLAR